MANEEDITPLQPSTQYCDTFLFLLVTGKPLLSAATSRDSPEQDYRGITVPNELQNWLIRHQEKKKNKSKPQKT